MNARVQRQGLQLKIVRHQDLLPNKKTRPAFAKTGFPL
jgi:hypothetical protein